MQSKNIVSSLLQKYSSDHLTDILLIIQVLSENRMLTPQKIRGLLSTLKELNVDSIDIKKSFTILTSSSVQSPCIVDAVQSKFNHSSIQQSAIDSDDIFVSVSGEGMNYKRSLNHDLDLIFKN